MRKRRQKFFVEESDSGVRLDKFLSSKGSVGTRSFIQNLIDQELVYFRGRPVKSSHKVAPGESFEVFLPDPKPSSLIPYEFPLDIVHEDDDLIVVNKPAGLVVHPAHGHESDTLVNALIFHNKSLSSGHIKERPGLIHRLDRDTSGLLVVAKTESAQNLLAKQFELRTAKRRYYALVYGTPKIHQGRGRIESFLARHPTDRKRFASLPADAPQERGKRAVTHYRILDTTHEMSLLDLKLETGRTHQIRVHLSELGHPIVGDDTYGGKKRASGLKSPALRSIILDLPRFALHAYELGFVHPQTGESVLFRAPWPEDLVPLLEKTKVFVPEVTDFDSN